MQANKRHLFIHPNFPGQFLHVARHLVAQGADVLGVGEHANVQRQAGMVKGARLLGYKLPRRAAKETHHYLRGTEENALRGQAVLRLCLALKKEGYRPDVIAAHTGWGDTLFLREAFPQARISGYFEYYYRPRGADIAFDPEFRMNLDNLLEVRMKNATSLLAWEDCDVRWTPTRWQASLFPMNLKSDLRIQHEGVDTKTIRPNPDAKATLPDGSTVHAGEEILTFVNRNMEPYRGFHVFMRALPEILSRRPLARVLITGMENDTSYGNKPTDGLTWRQRLLKEVGERMDLSRVHFLGKLPFDAHLRVLQLSRAHVYLTYPYFVSWSMLEAMSAGCMVIGSNTPPVTEFIEDGKTGLLVDFFDIPGLANRVCEALAEPRRFDSLRENARKLIADRYDRDSICVPALLKMFEG
jgi:glycosyltransferase involved in cell wall biosynthesis